MLVREVIFSAKLWDWTFLNSFGMALICSKASTSRSSSIWMGSWLLPKNESFSPLALENTTSAIK